MQALRFLLAALLRRILPESRKAQLAVALGLVVVLYGVVYLVRGSGNALPDISLESATPAYKNFYPTQTFTARTPARAMVYTNPDGLAANTFKAIPLEKLKESSLTSATGTLSKQQNMVQGRAWLAQHGYSWAAEGFLSAVRKGDIPAITTYLETGMDVNTRNPFSSTALHAAAESNQPAAAKLLLAAGAQLDAATTNLQTPLHRAVASNYTSMAQFFLNAGSKVNATTLEGWSPLFYAVDNNNQVMLEMLVTSGGNVNLKDKFGNTALMIATRKNYMEISKRLIALGIDINATDLSGRTALHYAVIGGSYQLSKMLLQNGAKADARDRQGVLPMDTALANQDLALANLLLAHGSKRAQVLGTKEKGIQPKQ